LRDGSVPCHLVESNNVGNRSASSETRLVINSRDWAAVPLALVFLAMAMLIWLYRPLLLCDHSVGTCTLNANEMPGNAQQLVALPSLHEASIQTRHSTDEGMQSRVVLVTAAGPVLIGAAWSADQSIAATMAERINAFLAVPEAAALRLTPDRGMHYGSLAFLSMALISAMVFAFVSRHFCSVLDRNQGHYRIESRHWLRREVAEGKSSTITGTLEKSTGRRSQLGLLDVECKFHPLLIPGMSGSRKTRDLGVRVRRLLALEESRGLSSWDLKPKLDEVFNSIGRTVEQTEELAALELRL
jgi:hypothetical protein